MKIPPSKDDRNHSFFLLNDKEVRTAVRQNNLWWLYGNVQIWAKAIGWKRETFGPRKGQLGVVLVNPRTGERWHYGVDPRNGTLVLIEAVQRVA